MAKVKEEKTVGGSHYGWIIKCPGCKEEHTLKSKNPSAKDEKQREGWDFNNDKDKPTFYPSLRVRGYCGPDMPNGTCHSFITDGKIRFLDDCTHDLAGQTVDLPDW